MKKEAFWQPGVKGWLTVKIPNVELGLRWDFGEWKECGSGILLNQSQSKTGTTDHRSNTGVALAKGNIIRLFRTTKTLVGMLRAAIETVGGNRLLLFSMLLIAIDTLKERPWSLCCTNTNCGWGKVTLLRLAFLYLLEGKVSFNVGVRSTARNRFRKRAIHNLCEGKFDVHLKHSRTDSKKNCRNFSKPSRLKKIMPV